MRAGFRKPALKIGKMTANMYMMRNYRCVVLKPDMYLRILAYMVLRERSLLNNDKQ